MSCVKCQSDLAKCTCGRDLEKELLSVPNFAFKACVKCSKHYAKCQCDNPEWVIVGQGVE
jgi:hypothetical protein